MPDSADPIFDTLQAALAAADAAIETATADTAEAAAEVRMCVQAKIDALNAENIVADTLVIQAGDGEAQRVLDQLTDLKAELAKIAHGFEVATKVVGVLDQAIAKVKPLL